MAMLLLLVKPGSLASVITAALAFFAFGATSHPCQHAHYPAPEEELPALTTDPDDRAGATTPTLLQRSHAYVNDVGLDPASSYRYIPHLITNHTSPTHHDHDHDPELLGEQVLAGMLDRFSAIGRDELGPKHVCAKIWKIVFDEWIVQVPPEWWRSKFCGDVGAACAAWKGAIKNEFGYAGVIVTWQECWRMDKVYPSGGIDWLHMRYATPLFAQTIYAEWVIKYMRDRKNFRKHNVTDTCVIADPFHLDFEQEDLHLYDRDRE